MQTNGRIRENTLYFPGWNVLVDGLKTPIQFQDPKSRGLMTFPVLKGKHAIRIIFKETKIRLLSDVLSLFALAGIGFYAILKGVI